MNRTPIVSCLIIAGAIALAFTGCGGSDEEGVKVTGSVVKGSAAQEGVLVNFATSDTNQGSAKAARTDAGGKFEVRVKPGKYVVVLTKMVDRKGNVPKESEDPTQDQTQLEASGYLRNALPAKYAEASSSPLGVEIPTGGKELPPFDVSK